MQKVKRISSGKRIREIKQKGKVKEIGKEEVQFEEEFEEIPVTQTFNSPSRVQRRLVSKLKTPVKSLEDIPEIDAPKANTPSNGEDIKYKTASTNPGGRFSYSASAGGKLENYQGVNKDKYHSVESSNPEDKMRKEREENKAYAERNPFVEPHKEYQERALDNSGLANDRDKDSKNKRRRDFM